MIKAHVWRVYMKLIFSFKEGMVLDRYSSLEVGEAATTSWIFFLRKRNQMILFETIFSRLHVFFYIFIYLFYFLLSSPEMEGLWLRSFSWFIRIMLVQKGRVISPIFNFFFFMKLRNSCMFSKLSEMTIFRSCSMKFFWQLRRYWKRYFGGTENNCFSSN